MLLSKAMLVALLPPGSLWTPQEGEGFDNLLTGTAECLEIVRAEVMRAAHVRDPMRTPVLKDLEKEYGVIPAVGADELARRVRLESVKASRSGDGSLDFLQARLTAAGFAVHVYANNPPVDPGFFVHYAASSMFGNDESRFGAGAFGALRGEVLVNGAIYLNQAKVTYELPTDPGYWPLFFFVGGEVTRGDEGQITTISDAYVPAERRAELASLILKCKPMSTWAGLRIKYT